MKSILITGASRGIGRATAVLAAGRGWNIAVNYRSDREAAEATVALCREAGGAAVALRGDVRDEEQVAVVFDKAQAAFGRLSGVVINAGVVAPAARLVDMDGQRLRDMVEINLLGALYCARQAARRLKGVDGASIVGVSSLAARTGSPDEYVDYAATKGALDTLTLGLAREVGRDGIRVNSVRPAFIDTDIHASGGRADRAHVLGATTPLGRAGRAEEVAETIVWLLSDAASYVSGAIVDVSGGK